jgi:hypothetical protein
VCPEGGGVSPDVVNDIREDGRLLGEVMTTNLRLRHEQRDDLAPVLLPRRDERLDAEVVQGPGRQPRDAGLGLERLTAVQVF